MTSKYKVALQLCLQLYFLVCNQVYVLPKLAIFQFSYKYCVFACSDVKSQTDQVLTGRRFRIYFWCQIHLKPRFMNLYLCSCC